jgi:hypothetical protein
MKYLLMYWDDDAADPEAANDPAFLAELRTWVDGMTERGTRLHGGPLGFAREAKLLRVRDGEMLVSDGPFAETKEQVGGYDVIECPDLAAALAVAAAHPLARSCTVEVRPVDLLPWEPAANAD